MNVYVRFDFLTSAECAAAIAMFPARAQGQVNGAQQSLRNSQTAFLKPTTTEQSMLVSKVFSLVTRANEVSYSFDLSTYEPLQIAEYSDGGEYGWHMDNGEGEAALRKLSVSIQLSRGTDYDGGDLELWGVGIDKDLRAQGTAVVFPSYMLHRVHPVTRGMRRSLVCWAIGDKPFR